MNEKRRTGNNKCLDRINYILYPILDNSSKTIHIETKKGDT